jgi:hypothetical protein
MLFIDRASTLLNHHREVGNKGIITTATNALFRLRKKKKSFQRLAFINQQPSGQGDNKSASLLLVRNTPLLSLAPWVS